MAGRLGIGIGGGVQWDPLGKRPGSDSSCKNSQDKNRGGGVAVGWQGNGGGSVGVGGLGVGGSVAMGGGYDFGTSNTYKDVGLTGQGGYDPFGKTGASLGGNIGLEFSIYDKGDGKCTCQ